MSTHTSFAVPRLSNRFWIECEKITDAYFTECSGLQATTETMEYKEGGLNSVTHKLPTRTSFGNITLKRGFAQSSSFWDWYSQTIAGKPQLMDFTIAIYSSDQPERGRRWLVRSAYPVKYTGPDLKSSSNEFTIESIEFAHYGISPL